MHYNFYFAPFRVRGGARDILFVHLQKQKCCMRNKITSMFSTGVSWLLAACAQPVEKPSDLQRTNPPVSFYSFKMKDIDGNEIDFKQYKGKKALLVNVASECGYTPQYAELQKLQELYENKIEVLAFPANDFGSQEPGSNAAIKMFCKNNYNVTFRLFEKISVKGNEMHPLYQWLTDKSKNGWNDMQPDWNFTKYLVDENGVLVAFFPTRIKPMDKRIVSKIKK